MKLRVQVVIESDDEDDEHPPAVHEVAQIDRDALSLGPLGVHLEEAKHPLQKVQAVLIDEQVRTYLAQQVACPSCGRARAHRDAHTIVVRTLFGTLHLRSPRWWQCSCQPQPTRTFSSLAVGRDVTCACHRARQRLSARPTIQVTATRSSRCRQTCSHSTRSA